MTTISIDEMERMINNWSLSFEIVEFKSPTLGIRMYGRFSCGIGIRSGCPMLMQTTNSACRDDVIREIYALLRGVVMIKCDASGDDNGY